MALAAGAVAVACGPAATPPARSPATPPAGEYVPFTDISKDLAERNEDLAWMGAHPLYVLATPTVRYFVVPTRCGQGPFEVHIPVSSTPWIELWRSYLLSPRALKGRDAEQSPRFGGSSFFGDGPHSDGPPDNARCVLTAAERSAAERDAARGPAARPAAAVPTPAPAAGAAAPLGALALREIPPPRDPPRARRYDLGGGTFANGGSHGAKVPDGAEVVIRIWFDEPNDLEGVVFAVEHATAGLTISGAEYPARVAARDQELNAKREQDERDLETSVAAQQTRRTFCEKHHDDRGCWPEGYEQAMAKSAEARRQLEEESRRKAEAYAHRPPPPPKEPDRPPPPARAETPPPQPSAHATWIAGYWHWIDPEWLWLDGRWRVPEEDVARDFTVHAPAPPPAPRAEATPPPRPALAWTPGYWQWDGARWLWIAGAWRQPPSPSATWIPDCWLRRAAGAVFLPGGWSVELRLPR